MTEETLDKEQIQEELRQLDENADVESNDDEGKTGVFVSPHPLGGIQVTVRSADGSQTPARLDLGDAAILLVHLQSLITMAFETVYMQQAMAAQEAANAQSLYVPRR